MDIINIGIMERKIKLSTLNEHLSCVLCKGYLIEATTIVECLHTFCKSCIYKHFMKKNITCPKCNNIVHQSHPLNYISFDRTMQDIVYKLVPNLEEKEIAREKSFYKKRGLAYPKEHQAENNNNSTSSTNNKNNNNSNGNSNNNNNSNNNSYNRNHEHNGSNASNYHRMDEQINLTLEPHHACDLKNLKKKYIRCSCQATVTHLKKLIALKLYNNMDKHKEVDLLCNDNLLGKDHTLKFVSVTEWRHRVPPIKLCYRPRVDY